jgi:mannan endo-1,4-beta-mannosidase
VEYYDRTGKAQVRVSLDKITPTFAEWKGQYWSNRDLKGDPALTRNDKNIDFDWKTDAAAQGLPKDNFSVRWTRDIEFASGTYRFYAKADDGIRVFLDGERVLNEWRDSDGSKEHQFDSTLEGKHTLRVEYYERGTRAHVKFWWEQQ